MLPTLYTAYTKLLQKTYFPQRNPLNQHQLSQLLFQDKIIINKLQVLEERLKYVYFYTFPRSENTRWGNTSVPQKSLAKPERGSLGPSVTNSREGTVSRYP